MDVGSTGDRYEWAVLCWEVHALSPAPHQNRWGCVSVWQSQTSTSEMEQRWRNCCFTCLLTIASESKTTSISGLCFREKNPPNRGAGLVTTESLIPHYCIDYCNYALSGLFQDTLYPIIAVLNNFVLYFTWYWRGQVVDVFHLASCSYSKAFYGQESWLY